MVTDVFPHGTVHRATDEVEAAIRADAAVLSLWQALTPLGRNEFLCWIEDARQAKTRERRIVRAREELLEGKTRPCCWVGCIHLLDKPPSRWQQAVLIDRQKR